jgi:hypothetical protein
VARPFGFLLLPARQAHHTPAARRAALSERQDIRAAVDTGREERRDVARTPGAEANPPDGRFARAAGRFFHVVKIKSLI